MSKSTITEQCTVLFDPIEENEVSAMLDISKQYALNEKLLSSWVPFKPNTVCVWKHNLLSLVNKCEINVKIKVASILKFLEDWVVKLFTFIQLWLHCNWLYSWVIKQLSEF